MYVCILERGEGREKGRERHRSVASRLSPDRDHTTTQSCALTGNGTTEISLCGTMPNQLSHIHLGILDFSEWEMC